MIAFAKPYVRLCLLLLATLLLISCQTVYVAEYPEEMTPYYCHQNYTYADPNLIHMATAKNDTGAYRGEPGVSIRYYAIPGVSMQKYLVAHEIMLLGGEMSVIRHKDLKEDPILDYEIKSAELFWRSGLLASSTQGQELYLETLAAIDGQALQAHIRDSLANGEYSNVYDESSKWITTTVEREGVKYETSPLYVRVTFADYENLVWDACLYRTQSGECYLVYYAPAEEGYTSTYIPVNEDILTKLPS